jgi:hypothetical protein
MEQRRAHALNPKLELGSALLLQTGTHLVKSLPYYLGSFGFCGAGDELGCQVLYHATP